MWNVVVELLAKSVRRRDNRRLLRDAEYVRHNPIVRQRFRISKRKATRGPFLGALLGFGPACFGGFTCASFALLIGHRLQAALASDPSALGPHLAHDSLNNRKFSRF